MPGCSGCWGSARSKLPRLALRRAPSLRPRRGLFLAAPVASKGRLLQYAGRILRPYHGKATAEVHDYHDELTGVLASSLAKRAPGYTGLSFPDPRKLPNTPSAGTPCPAQL
jgi:hypothetical protein